MLHNMINKERQLVSKFCESITFYISFSEYNKQNVAFKVPIL